jgi:hypothetical protein
MVRKIMAAGENMNLLDGYMALEAGNKDTVRQMFEEIVAGQVVRSLKRGRKRKSPAKTPKKAKGGPSKPRKPRQALDFYTAATKKDYKADPETKSMKAAEVKAMCEQAWPELAEEDKLPFMEQAEEDIMRFENAMAVYKIKLEEWELQQEAEESKKKALEASPKALKQQAMDDASTAANKAAEETGTTTEQETVSSMDVDPDETE